MDIDSHTFYHHFLEIVRNVSEAHFVAFDLELAGVPAKKAWGSTPGRPSLQQRYLEIKTAAERHPILQIGLTCVEQDLSGGRYILKPYNFDLSPFITEPDLDVDRVVSFQSKAVSFLLSSGFNLGRTFSRGVPYLSRAESKSAREQVNKRLNRKTLPDIEIKSTDVESLAFVDRVRQQIKTWMGSRGPDRDQLILEPIVTEPSVEDSDIPELSRYEKRLIHQTLRAEFPNLTAFSRDNAMYITDYDKDREEWDAARYQAGLEQRIQRQKGFRWIIEALCGTNISNFDTRLCARNPRPGASILADLDDYKARLYRAAAELERKPVILVGHNCLLDLVYIYHAFIGNLPDTVEEFQTLIHQLWPVIIDTKYMSTHGCGDINPMSSLYYLATKMSDQDQPQIVTDPLYPKYNGTESFAHEAGYDSYLTAQIAVRLSSKLESEGTYVDLAKDFPDTKTELEKRFSELIGNRTLRETNPNQANESPWGETNEIAGNEANTPPATSWTPSIPGAPWKQYGDPTLGPLPKDDLFPYTPMAVKRKLHRGVKPRITSTLAGGMPAFGSDFWRVYGNKLRVFGTEEGVCYLDGAPRTSAASTEPPDVSTKPPTNPTEPSATPAEPSATPAEPSTDLLAVGNEA